MMQEVSKLILIYQTQPSYQPACNRIHREFIKPMSYKVWFLPQIWIHPVTQKRNFPNPRQFQGFSGVETPRVTTSGRLEVWVLLGSGGRGSDRERQ